MGVPFRFLEVVGGDELEARAREGGRSRLAGEEELCLRVPEGQGGEGQVVRGPPPAGDAVEVSALPVVIDDRGQLVREAEGVADERGRNVLGLAGGESPGARLEPEVLGEDVEAAAEGEGVIEAGREGRLVGRGEEGGALVDEGAFEPEADAEVPLAVEAEAVLGNGVDGEGRGRVEWVHDGHKAVDRGLAAVVGRADLALEEGDLDAAAELGGLRVGRGQVEAAAGVVAIHRPGPEVGVAVRVEAKEQGVDAVGELEGVAGVEGVEPHHRPEDRGRAEADLLEAGAGLEARGREADPGPVGLDVAREIGFGVADEEAGAVGVGRGLGVEGDAAGGGGGGWGGGGVRGGGGGGGAARGEREPDLRDEAQGEEGLEAGVETGRRLEGDLAAERERGRGGGGCRELRKEGGRGCGGRGGMGERDGWGGRGWMDRTERQGHAQTEGA